MPAPLMTRRARAGWLIAATVAGIALGLGGMVFSRADYSADDVVGALAISPLVVTVGGRMVDVPELLRTFFLMGGCLFWPGYAVLTWRWMATGNRYWLAGVLLWCAQGYFQVVLRYQGVMSV